MQFSVIIPVFNRPDEVDELLESLTKQTYRQFEVIVVEDGSTRKCDDLVNKYRKTVCRLFLKSPIAAPDNRGNVGVEQQSTNISFFSIRIASFLENYFHEVNRSLSDHYADAYGA